MRTRGLCSTLVRALPGWQRDSHDTLHDRPPHILERVAARADDPALRDIARRTAVLSTAARTERRISAATPPDPTEDFVPDRTIKDADNLEQLPGKVVRSEGDAATGDGIADQAYDWLGVTFDFFEAAYRRNSIDGAACR